MFRYVTIIILSGITTVMGFVVLIAESAVAQGMTSQSCIMAGRNRPNENAMGYGCAEASGQSNEDLCASYMARVPDNRLARYVTSAQSCSSLGFNGDSQATNDGKMYYCMMVQPLGNFHTCSPQTIQTLRSIIGF